MDNENKDENKDVGKDGEKDVQPRNKGKFASRGGTKRAKVIGRMIAAGELNAHGPITWAELLSVFDVCENTAHGAARRAELVEKGVLAE